MSKKNRQRTCRRLRITAVISAAFGVLALAVASPALADPPIQNPFFKDQGVSGSNSGTDLSGWTTSPVGQVISTSCWTNTAGSAGFDCKPENGTTIPVVGSAGTPTPSQALTSGGMGTSGVFKSIRSTDIYNGDLEWKAGNPGGNSVIPQQSNYALIPTSCQNGQPAPNTLSQTFYALKDQVLTGYSFFTSQDWVPDSGTVKITAPDGTVQPVYRARIVGDNDATPAGSWDHPVQPTVHQLNNGTWVMPHGDPATPTWIAQHQAGVSGTPWTTWTYRFPQDGNYTITATSNESTDPAFPIDCNMPSMMGLQFQTPTPIKDGLTIDTTPTSATYGDAPFSIANKATVYASRNPSLINPTGKGVTFSTSDPDCSVTSGGTVTIRQVGDGVCNVTVRAPGNFYYYAPETKNLPITINPKVLHVDAPDETMTYGDVNPDPTSDATFRLSDLANGDSITSVIDSDHPGSPDCSIDPSAGPAVGSYAGAIHCDGGSVNLVASTGNQPNYTLQAGNNGTLTITPASQSVNLPQLADRTVGDPNVDPGATATSALPVAYGSATPSVCTITSDGMIQIHHAGTCAILASQPGNNNYNAAQTVAGMFDVAKANQTISFNSLSDRGFGDGDFTINASATSQLPVTFASSTPSVCTVDANTGAVHILATGDCMITASQAGNGDYNAAPAVTQKFHIASADQTITFPALADKTWGDQDIDLGATASSGLPVSYTAQGSCQVVNGKVHITGVGTCTVTANQGGDQRYSSAPPVSRTFQVNPAQLTVKADDKSKTYGDANPSFTYGITGFVNGDSLSSATNGSATCSSNAGQGAGSYAINCSQGTLSASNYSFNYAPGTLTVNKAQLTVKADDKSKTYGDANPIFTYGITGFVTGDSQSSATSGVASCSSSAGQSSGAGSYGIGCAQGGLQASPNYTLKFVDGTLTVNKAQLTVKADDKSKTYGDPNPNFTYGITGFVNGDTQASATNGSATCSSNAGQGAGSYAINCSQGTLSASNYSFNYAPGTLTVNKAQLTVKADDKSKTYGDPNPNFTYSLNGLVSGDTASSATTGSPSCSSNAGQGSDVGSYPINCSQGNLAASNYNVNYSPGSLTVNKANQSINLGSIADKFFGQDDFNASATASSGLSVSYAASGDCTVDPSSGKVHLQLPSQWPGNCTITASQGGNGDYNAAQSVSQSFKIATAALAGGGIFDIGNLDASVGNNVNWWGSQWAKQNDLTAGPGPDAFKGYIDNVSSYPPQCGTTWTTRPGNSSKPPDSVPQYMTVVVSSNVSKSGPSITGDVQSVVVVKTDGGYDSNPGHWGTGTIVAKLCGSKLNQSINFSQPADHTVTDADFDPGASASSNLPVNYTSQTPSVCNIVNGQVDVTGVGDCTITASQDGNDVFSAASPVTRTFKVTAISPISCNSTDKKSKTKCESVLVNPSPGANAIVTAGQKMTIGYTDDSPIPTTGSQAPTAVLSDGRSLPVTVTPTSGLPYSYVTNYKQDKTNKNQALLSFQLPANLTSGSYTVMVTAYDGDGDVDQWSWPVRVN